MYEWDKKNFYAVKSEIRNPKHETNSNDINSKDDGHETHEKTRIIIFWCDFVDFVANYTLNCVS